MVCPKCKGKGYLKGFGCPGFKPMKLTCPICKGGKTLPSNIAWKPEEGKAQRDRRVYGTPYKNIREAAKERGVSVAIISEEEQGFFREGESPCH